MGALKAPFGMPVVSGSSSLHGVAEQNKYFVTTTPTPGTPFSYMLRSAFSDTRSFLYLLNASGTKRAYLQWIKILVATVPASGTQAYYAIKTDNVARAFSTDNTTVLVPVEPYQASPAKSSLIVQAQNSATASVIAAGSAASRIVARGSLGGIPVIGDELVINCGAFSEDMAFSGLTAAQAIAPGRKCSNSPPIILDPGHSAVLYLWFPGNATTPLSYELEMGHWEV